MDDGRRRRAGALAGCASAAAALHLALLGGLRWTWEVPPLPAPRALQVRTVASLPAAPVARAAPAAVDVPVDAAASPGPRRARTEAHGAPGRAKPRPALGPLAAGRARPTPPAPAPAPAPATTTAGVDPAADDAPPPVYRTRLPPPATLHYDVRRGPAAGAAALHWRRGADGYTLDWQIRVGDAAVLAQSSRGAIDAAGVAPLRFVDQRPSRAAAAANFRRDVGRISFSRKAADAVLVPGAQDRLSWLLQLAAIVAAEPDLRGEGAQIRIAVAGAGGEVAVWRFRCTGEAPVERDAGPALRFVREPGGPYETRAEVWLEETSGRFLPLRVDWRAGPADEGFELRLRETVDLPE